MTAVRNTKIAAFALATLAFLATPAFAADTTSASLSLSGTVPLIQSITVTPTVDASSLKLTTVESNLLIATVLEKSNRRVGYSVSLNSANNFKLVSGDANDDIAYALSYDGSAVGSNGAVVTDVNAKTAIDGVSKELRISFDGASAYHDTGVYTDTLTFTLTAK